MSERELIEEAQDNLAALKSNLRKLRDKNVKAGRRAAANAVLGLIGDLTRFHANAMAELDAHYPEFSGEVQDRGELVAYGGGGPRG